RQRGFRGLRPRRLLNNVLGFHHSLCRGVSDGETNPTLLQWHYNTPMPLPAKGRRGKRILTEWLAIGGAIRLARIFAAKFEGASAVKLLRPLKTEPQSFGISVQSNRRHASR